MVAVLPADFFLLSFFSLVAVINPLSKIAIFPILLSSYSWRERRKTITLGAIIAFLSVSALLSASEYLLGALMNYLVIIKIVGGVVLLYTAANLIFKKRYAKRLSKYRVPLLRFRKRYLLSPIVFPLYVGGGTFVVSILLFVQARTPVLKSIFFISLFFAYFVNYLAALYSDRIYSRFGSATFVLGKLAGFLIACFSLLLILDGFMSSL